MNNLALPSGFIDNMIGTIHELISGYWPIVLLLIGLFIAFLFGEFLIDLFADWQDRRQEDFEAERSMIKAIERQIEMDFLKAIISETSLGIEITARAEQRARQAAEKLAGRPLSQLGQNF